MQSFVTTPLQVLQEFKNQTGSEFEVTYTTVEEIKKLEKTLWDKGVPQATSVTLRRIWATGGTLYAKNDNDVLEVKEQDLDTVEEGVKRYLKNRQRDLGWRLEESELR